MLNGNSPLKKCEQSVPRYSPHSPLLAVPFPRWGTLEGLRYNSICSANIAYCYNFV